MDPLNHLKTNYRQRYFNREGEKEVFDRKQGENVLQYIQGCFDTCAKKFKLYSPTTSCSSSSSERDQDQVPSHSENKEQPEHSDNKNILLNLFPLLPLVDKQDSCSVANLSEESGPSSESHASSQNELIDMISLGSPALLTEEVKSCDGAVHSEGEACEMDLQNSRDVATSERYHSGNAVTGLSAEKATCSAASSIQKKIPRSQASFETTQCSFTQRNTANVEPEDECEFLIEESFGSPSWVSLLGKNLKSQRKSLTSVLSQSKKGMQTSDVKRGDKRAPEKLATPNPAKQTETRSTNIAGQTVGGLENASRTDGAVSKSTRGKRQQRRSKDIAPVEINGRHAKVGSLVENHASFLEQDQNVLQPVLNTGRRSSVSKKRVEGASISVRLENEESEVYGSALLISEDSRESQHSNIRPADDVFALKPPAGSKAQPSAPTPESRCKRQNCKSTTSSRKTLQPRQSNVEGTLAKATRRRNKRLSSEENVERAHGEQPKGEHGRSHKIQGTNSSGKASLVTTERNVCGSLSSRKKLSEHGWTEGKSNTFVAPLPAQTPQSIFKGQDCKNIASSKKALQARRSNVEGTLVKSARSRKKSLLSKENFESEQEEGEKDVGEHGCANKTQSTNRSGKMSHQKGRQTPLVTTERNVCGSFSPQKTLSEHSWTEGKLNASVDQDSCSPDVNMNHVSGPVSGTNSTSEHDMEDSDLEDGSGLFEEDAEEIVLSSLKHKLVLPTNTPNVRRTKRMRIKPLEYWRGERVNYKTRPSGGFVFSGIISPEQNEPRKAQPKTAKRLDVEQENLTNSSAFCLKGLSQPAVVFDVESNQEVLLECVSSSRSFAFSTGNEAVSIYKHLSTPSFSTGKMILQPLKEKGFQYSHTDTLVFHIAQGKVLLTLYDQCYSLTNGDYFFIPPGNIYNLRNLLNKECVILFTQLKGSSCRYPTEDKSGSEQLDNVTHKIQQNRTQT